MNNIGSLRNTERHPKHPKGLSPFTGSVSESITGLMQIISQDSPVTEYAAKMASRSISSLVVIEASSMVGIVKSSDLLENHHTQHYEQLKDQYARNSSQQD